MTQDYPEEVLITRLQERDTTALTLLYDKYSASLYGVILRIVKDELVAEEAMQDCFVKIWSSFAFYDKDKGRLFTWLVTIARHVAIDKLRSHAYRQSRLNQSLDSVLTVNLRETHPYRPEFIGVKELVATLTSDQKKVIDLVYFEGYSHAEAAKALAIPLGTVKTRVRYALQLLRKLMVEPDVLAA
ncbi:DNA-directed RNA polymerase sigma-70 factor [Adhaeribacter aerolatus]|uniref:DNA-directed RNA polymerase sigma-70 factor n=1 Tax=Adhaeribacter aerolatus TaxID=670289 RepID=A0A512B6B7_9BACT|nr:sigma-70 family RNA polymerase sigma factor [Adhaeribacter aerolatus]GEO07317.1 DNA-directed RNA polymerase sigma-70 factor [Adhaeribacter aerolatus]